MTLTGTPERPEEAGVAPLRAGELPRRRLARGARWAWRLQQAGIWLVVAVAGNLIGGALGVPRALLLVAAAVLLVAAVAIVPLLRYSRWRWDLRPDAIDIQHGTFTIRRTLVPLMRVQHVDTRRGVLEQLLGLATVVIHTAAGSHTIPYLDPADAAELRDRIAALARTDA
ncbi:PH domain-containing protein [Candidatus Solirubrobacter pratensis]|uniref:PH domain-containing protein n=1 Tax=Candidatus Solirubrobacter pratensis TaxID=1298857 RepID=UPI00040659D3|nr:PH domain-containing protein [Candidatus Solirubrobacter pratensis]